MQQQQQYSYTSNDLRERDFTLWLAVKAYEHMRSLVIHNNKDGPKGKLRTDDLESAKVYEGSGKEGNVSAYTIVGGQPYYSTNTKSEETNYTLVDSQCDHAEMKLFDQFGSQLDYIGVSRLCCLYCAAQMLARGFTGFRGCHMKSFTGYVWLPDVHNDSAFRTALWGEEVESYLSTMNEDEWEKFLRKISNGGDVMNKFMQYYNDEYQPTYRKDPQNPFSSSNQKNYL